MWQILFSPQALKDRKHFDGQKGLFNKLQRLLDVVRNNPYQDPPPVKQLRGDLKGKFSRRIDHKHRLVYSLRPSIVGTPYVGVVYIERMWSHYGD